MTRLQYSYDAKTDIITIEGIRYHGDIFREFGFQLRVSHVFKLMNIKDTVITIQHSKEKK